MLLRQAVLVLEVGFIRTKIDVPNFDFNSEKKIESDLGSFLKLYFFGLFPYFLKRIAKFIILLQF